MGGVRVIIGLAKASWTVFEGKRNLLLFIQSDLYIKWPVFKVPIFRQYKRCICDLLKIDIKPYPVNIFSILYSATSSSRPEGGRQIQV